MASRMDQSWGTCMSEDILIFDAEIKNGVVTENNPMQAGFRYAKGWNDYAGMGISVVCGYHIGEARPRVFLEDNLSELVQMIERGTVLIGFNNWRFDNRLLFENGIGIPHGQSKDIAAAIWHAAGVPTGEHPKGRGLDAICLANGLPGKTGNGADAPQDFQRGRIGRVIDYCLGDIRSTLQLYRYITQTGGCKDPVTGEWLTVRI